MWGYRLSGMQKRKCHDWWMGVALLLISVGFLAWAPEIWARAGGGGGYAGGGGSGDGGGGGFGLLIYYWIIFCVHYPLVGLPLTALMIFLFMKYGKHLHTNYQGRVITRGAATQNELARLAALNTLRQRDPNFHENEFNGRVKTAFLKIQEAWCAQDMKPVEAFISDGIMERFGLQFDEQREEGWRDHMEQIHVLNVQVVLIESDTLFDAVSVRIDATAVDYRESLESGKRIDGTSSAESFTEYWTWLRRPGAKSLEGGGLIEGNCPNCGDKLVLNAASDCASCGAHIRNGEYDWVLTEITQACEWSARESTAIPGVEALQKTDPAFSTPALEDFCSVVFWRWMMAWRKDDPAVLRKMGTDKLCDYLQKQWHPQNTPALIPGDIAVGGIELKGIVLDEPVDQALLEVRWSAARYQKKGGKKVAEAHVSRHYFVIERRHGVKGDLNHALSSAHCPSCGAPREAVGDNRCRYCGTVLNDGATDWVLSAVYTPQSTELASLRMKLGGQMAATHTMRSPLERLAWMIQVMLADGVIDDKEREMLTAFAQSKRISMDRVEQMIGMMQAGQFKAPQPTRPGEADQWLDDMIDMALADGTISGKEQQLIETMAARLGYSRSDLKIRIGKRRGELFRQHRATAREAKRQTRENQS